MKRRTIPPAPYTPGPWRVYQEKPHYYSVGTDYAHDRGHDCNIVRDVRCEANARIMAASPELLNAAKSALIALIEHDRNAEYDWYSRQIALLEKAIAKAEGRAQ